MLAIKIALTLFVISAVAAVVCGFTNNERASNVYAMLAGLFLVLVILFAIWVGRC